VIPNNLITDPDIIRSVMREVLKAEPDPPKEDVAFWNRFVGIAQKWEQRFYSGYQGLDGIAKLFKRQGDDAVAGINGKSKTYEPYDLVDWDRYEILFEEFGQLLLPLIAVDYAQQELTRLGVVGISFDVLNPAVIDFAEDYSVRFAKSVNQTTLDMLKESLAEADRLGESIPQITKRIQALFTNMTKERAYMTARTETMRAQNFGAEQGYIESGVVEAKRWLAIDDLRTCAFCAYMNGKILVLGGTWFEQGTSITLPKLIGEGTQTFTFNYEAIKRPPAHPHDRCCLSPVVNEAYLR
jgi:SPP1 gp7 family putative phage head morphogenesis protein